MPTIEISAGFYDPGYVTHMINGSQQAFYGAGIFSTVAGINPPWGGRIRIMKGSVPTDFSTLTTANVRTSDILLEYTRGNWGTYPNSISINLTPSNPVEVTTAFINASASGTATWYWHISGYQNGNEIWYQSIGTVGVLGSGADLEMPTTSIVSGQPYKISNFKIQFPLSWTY